MTKPVSIDIRDRAMARLDAGGTVREAAEALSVAPSSVVKWLQRRRATGSAAPGRIGGVCAAQDPRGSGDVAADPDGGSPVHPARPGGRTRRTRAQGRRPHDVEFRPCRGAELEKTAPASEQDRPDVARKRQRRKARQGGIDPARLVFIGESAALKAPLVQAQRRTAKTDMTPLRGWSLRGKRLKGFAPFGRWNTMTFVAALRHDGITAPSVIDGPINGEIFRTDVEHVLVPTLRPNDIVILDNLGSHKAPAIRRAIRAAGARRMFLPAYSPDLNPIEQVFAKLKHLRRKAAERSKDTVWRRIGSLLDQFTPQECANYLGNSGYGADEPLHALRATMAECRRAPPRSNAVP